MGKSTQNNKLLFVYNADSNLVSRMIDVGHKYLSPGTYQCNLCKLAYGVLSMKDEWRDFLDSLDIPIGFVHRDKFHKQFGMKNVDLPAVFQLSDDKMELTVTANQMNEVSSLDDLIDMVRFKI